MRISSSQVSFALATVPPGILIGTGWEVNSIVSQPAGGFPVRDVTFQLKGAELLRRDVSGSLLAMMSASGVPEMTAMARLVAAHRQEFGELLDQETRDLGLRFEFAEVAP